MSNLARDAAWEKADFTRWFEKKLAAAEAGEAVDDEQVVKYGILRGGLEEAKIRETLAAAREAGEESRAKKEKPEIVAELERVGSGSPSVEAEAIAFSEGDTVVNLDGVKFRRPTEEEIEAIIEAEPSEEDLAEREKTAIDFRLEEFEEKIVDWVDVREVEEEEREAPIIDLKTPMKTAEEYVRRHCMFAEEGTLARWQGCWWNWEGGVWEEWSEEQVRSSQIYPFLGSAVHHSGKTSPEPVNPTPAIVNQMMDTLKSVVHLGDKRQMPGWIGKGVCPVGDVKEFAAMGNGLLYLPLRRLVPHSPQFWSLNRLEYEFDEEAKCPRWEQFMEELFPSDVEVKALVQEMFGLFLTDVTACHTMFQFVGPTRGGRGTIGRVLKALIGERNVIGSTFNTFSGRFGLESWVGKKVAVFGDATLEGVSKREKGVVGERLKMITGEDSVPIERKNKVDLNLVLSARIVTFSNQPLEYVDHSGALMARIKSVQMTKSFAGNPDRGLTGKLLAELPGIFNWSLVGLDRLRENGWIFRQPKSGEALAEQVANLASSVRGWLGEKVDTKWEGDKATRELALFGSYKRWCEARNIWPGTAEQFGNNLRAALPGHHFGRPRAVEGEGEGNPSRPMAVYGVRLRARV